MQWHCGLSELPCMSSLETHQDADLVEFLAFDRKTWKYFMNALSDNSAEVEHTSSRDQLMKSHQSRQPSNLFRPTLHPNRACEPLGHVCLFPIAWNRKLNRAWLHARAIV